MVHIKPYLGVVCSYLLNNSAYQPDVSSLTRVVEIQLVGEYSC